MFTMAKVWAGVVAAFGFVLLLLKIEKSKNEKLEDENQALELKDEITNDMELARKVAKQKEVERNENRKKDSDNSKFPSI